MSNIVKRLRRRREQINRGNGDVIDIPDEDCMEAADEIERLQEELNTVHAHLRHLWETLRRD